MNLTNELDINPQLLNIINKIKSDIKVTSLCGIDFLNIEDKRAGHTERASLSTSIETLSNPDITVSLVI